MIRLPVRIEVYVQPRASKTGLAGTHGGLIKICIAAPPVKNAANRALIGFIAKHLGIAKRCVRCRFWERRAAEKYWKSMVSPPKRSWPLWRRVIEPIRRASLWRRASM